MTERKKEIDTMDPMRTEIERNNWMEDYFESWLNKRGEDYIAFWLGPQLETIHKFLSKHPDLKKKVKNYKMLKDSSEEPPPEKEVRRETERFAYQRESDESSIRERWDLTSDLDILIEKDPKDLIFVGNVDDLRQELHCRYPAPKGFTFVIWSEWDPDSVFVKTNLHTTPSTQPEDVIDAVRNGWTPLPVWNFKNSILERYGYSQDEITFFTHHSKIRCLPLEEDIVMVHYGNKEIVRDKDKYKAACKALKLSRANRKTSKV